MPYVTEELYQRLPRPHPEAPARFGEENSTDSQYNSIMISPYPHPSKVRNTD